MSGCSSGITASAHLFDFGAQALSTLKALSNLPRKAAAMLGRLIGALTLDCHPVEVFQQNCEPGEEFRWFGHARSSFKSR